MPWGLRGCPRWQLIHLDLDNRKNDRGLTGILEKARFDAPARMVLQSPGLVY
jgi:hypothetical protein